MVWKPPEDDETISPASAPAAPAWTPPVEDESVSSPLGDAVSSIHTGDVTPPALPEGIPAKISAYLQRIMKAHDPLPRSMEDLKGALSPTPGKVGMGRFLEEEGKRVGEAVRGSGENLAEGFVELPGVRQFPEAAAVAGSTGSAVVDLLSDTLTPSGAAQNIGGDAMLRGVKGLELAGRARVGEKVSGLPPRVSRAIKESPEFFEKTKGTPEAIDAENQAIKSILEEAKAGHVAKTTAEREAARAGQLAEVEGGVKDIQNVINSARENAGKNLESVREGMGLNRTLEQEASDIATGAARDLGPEEVVRQAMGALDPKAPKGPESMRNLLDLRQSIDDLLSFSRKGVKPVGGRQEAVLSRLRGKINDRIEGITAPTFERSTMGAESSTPSAPDPVGKRFREADRAFSETAGIVEGLRPKFETVPKGVSTIRAQAAQGLRSVDPDVAALESLAGGKEALSRAEIAERAFVEGEKAFSEGLKRFDHEIGKFKDAPTGVKTVSEMMDTGLEKVDPTAKAIRDLPKGGEALERMKAEVNRFDAERVDIQPNGVAQTVAQVIGITPQRAARWLSQAVHSGAFPSLSRAATILGQAAARGPEALATTNFLLQQQDDEYRQAVQAMQQGGDQ